MSRIDLQPPPYADTILLIKHFPSIFNDSDRCEFVQHFGAKRIRSFHDNTTSILNERLKNLIIADFGTSVQARQALYRLHQLEILNKRLVVEYARLDLVQEAFAQQDQEKLKKLLAKLSGRKDDENELFEQQLHGLSAPNDVMYPIRSNLKYRYPQINDQILQNISNALLAVPPFYTQVIHLMNKMSLPCPFGGPTPRRPGETVSQACQADYTELQKEFLTNSENQTNVDMETDTDESELGDDQDLETNLKHNRLQRKANLNIQKQRLKSYRQSNIINKEKSNQIHLENVFDDLSNIKQQTTPIDIKLPTNVELTTITKKFDQSSTNNFTGFGRIDSIVKSSLDNTMIENNNDGEQLTSYITLSELEKNRLPTSELQKLPAYKNYERGDVSYRLYLKNISKFVDENDLKYVYGRYIDFSNIQHQNTFDIRLMKEGKMKGQAFITMPSEQLAVKALQDTNGYILKDKPLIVQFARTQKAKLDKNTISE